MEAAPTLRALVDRIVPADEFPSGWAAGAGTFIERMLAADLRHHAPLVAAGLVLVERETAARHPGRSFAELAPEDQDALFADLLAGRTTAPWEDVDPRQFAQLLIQLANEGFYSDPEQGGNRDAVAWTMIGYRPLPPGQSWPPLADEAPALASWDGIAEHYDAIVVGAGAGGGIAACVLAEGGLRVLLVERGTWLRTHDLRADHLRNHRVALGYDYFAGPPTAGNPRVWAGAAGAVVIAPPDGRWHNVAMTVGGGTRVYGAQAWRFSPEDFRMASTYGVPDGSDLRDWPIGYADLEPCYDRAEWELGVSGDPAGNAYAGPRRRGYPMPPLPDHAGAATLRRGADALGLATGPVPLLINSVPYNGRGACINCGTCVGFGCPGEFKTDTRNSVIPRAIATGRCDVLTDVQVERITVDATGSVTGVALVTERDGRVERRGVAADQLVLGAGAIETARLLLNSRSPHEPNGIGNNADQVGRYLQGHAYAGAVALFDDVVQQGIGPGPRIATNDFRHHNPGIVGGGMLANDFVPLPLYTWKLLSNLGAIPRWGMAAKQGMRDLYRRMTMLMGPIQEIPVPDARVTVDPEVRDRFGIPVARLSGRVHPQDADAVRFLQDQAVAWAEASGAARTFRMGGAPADGPSAGQHQAGTCRMGSDPAHSVTDAWGVVWGHPNLRIVDASLHVTNGGVNPVLTIMALAYRVSQHLIDTLAASPNGREAPTTPVGDVPA